MKIRRRRSRQKNEGEPAAYVGPRPEGASGDGLAFQDNRKEAASLARVQRMADAGSRSPVQRLADKPATPGGLKATLKALEKAVRAGNSALAGTHLTTLFNANNDYAIKLLLYKLQKHQNDAKLECYKRLDPRMGTMALGYAIQRRDSVPIGTLSPFLSSLSDAELLQLARMNEAYFITNVLTPAKDQYPERMVPLLKKHALMAHLKARAAAEYNAFAGETPQLNVVETVAPGLGHAPNNRQIADAIFNAVITNTGIDLAYMGTAVTPVEHALTGDTRSSGAYRARQAAVIPNLPAIPATDCHHLLTIFQDIVQTFPGFTGAPARVTLNNAVLTRPMSQMPGGLIANTFGGNTFNEDGSPTGQIFFTGEDGINSHSWLTIDGRAYDPLFGTTGDAVAQGAAGTYQRVRAGVYRASAGDGYLVKDTRLAVPNNPHSFNTAYRKTNDPGRWEA